MILKLVFFFKILLPYHLGKSPCYLVGHWVLKVLDGTRQYVMLVLTNTTASRPHGIVTRILKVSRTVMTLRVCDKSGKLKTVIDTNRTGTSNYPNTHKRMRNVKMMMMMIIIIIIIKVTDGQQFPCKNRILDT
jgi:predicted nucleic acid-binding Zn ribbon protein